MNGIHSSLPEQEPNPATKTSGAWWRPGPRVVLFDGHCGLCRASRKWVARLDWFGVISWINFRDPEVRAAISQLSTEQLEKEMWVVTGTGRMLPGFAGWRHLLRGLPLTFVPSLLLYLPLIPFIGKRVYAFIAARRPIKCELAPAAPRQQRGGWEAILQHATVADVPENKDAALLITIATCLLFAIGCGKQPESRGSAESGPEVIKMSATGDTISVVAVGDVLLGNASRPYLETNGYDWPFEKVKVLLGSANLVIGNLAAPITTTTKQLSSDDEYTYKVNLESGPALKRAGFHALSVGNNHVLDYGIAGMQETIATLRTNGIASFGAGESEHAARRGVVYDFGSLRIGLLGYGDDANDTRGRAKGARGGYAGISRTDMTQDIARMRTNADIVVVSFHWGKNYKDVTESQQKTGRRAIDLGADIVWGHHPHVTQGIELYQGKPIIYSLGNFVFGTKGKFKENQGYGMVARCVFEGKTLKWVLATPVAVNNDIVRFQPQRVPADEARLALEPHLNRYDTPFRWDGDTAFIGLVAEAQTAALPSLPWQPIETQTTNAPSAASVSISANP